ncbi:MAG: hypothetical protein LBM09_01650 [Candidatus Nomurabacteria bacterium]|jgi:hypothetical protein|nr:hypothetical protein [Candidatus Nomurabacteria bacterium]
MNEKNPEKQIVEKIKKVSNILVTVSRNPNVDQLASALALTILLNNLKKHATAVFSGQIPPVMNFLAPEKTFENNADSLRDFIILLDKNKADRLRMKTDGDIVKILITPYRTKITSSDISFSDGDFNVELVIAIGVDNRDELDQALLAHGRIFHDAVLATLNITDRQDNLGTISWKNTAVNSYSEMVSEIVNDLSDNDISLLDEQISTALLTGIVATTNQFRNNKTTPEIMKLSADLMAKGANQQLVASELAASKIEKAEETKIPEEVDEVSVSDEIIAPVEPPKSDDSLATLEIRPEAPVASENDLDSLIARNNASVSSVPSINEELQNITPPTIAPLEQEPVAQAESPVESEPIISTPSEPIQSTILPPTEPVLPVSPPPIEPEASPANYDDEDYSPSEPTATLPSLEHGRTDLQIPPMPSLSTPLPPPPPLPMPDFHDMPPLPAEPTPAPEPTPQVAPNETITPSDNSVIFPTGGTEERTSTPAPATTVDPSQFQIPS